MRIIRINDNSYSGTFTVGGTCQDPNNPHTLLAAIDFEGNGDSKILKSIDSAHTWTEKYTIAANLRRIEMSPLNPSSIIASGNKVCLSTNGGENWTDITDSLVDKDHYILSRAAATFHPTILNRILVVLKKVEIDNPDNGSVEYYISNDNGSSFSLLNIVQTPDYYLIDENKMEIECSKLNSNIFYTGGLNVYKNTINGSSLTINYISNDNDIHVDVRCMKTSVFSNTLGTYERLVVGNDGGVAKYPPSGWVDLTGSGLNITQYYGIGISKGARWIQGGTQDGNVDSYKNGHWSKTINFGDAAECVINHRNNDTAYIVTFCTNPYFSRTTDGGETWYSSEFGVERRNDAPLEISNQNPKNLLFGGDEAWITTDAGETFQPISNFSQYNTTKLKVLRFAPSDNKIIYAACGFPTWNHSDERRLFRGVGNGNNNFSWVDITPENIVSYAGIFDLAVDPINPNIIYITLDRNWQDHKVFQGTIVENNGIITVNWINISQGLENLPVNCIELYPGNNLEEMFVGTDDGVYYRNNTLSQWMPFSNGMPVISVSDLEIDYDNNELIASTFGRGIYKTSLCELSTSNETIYIKENEVWKGLYRIPGDIVVSENAVLTINGVVKMKKGQKIKVEIGGQLIIDGGILTNNCRNEFWEGIEVEGTKDKPENLLYQGMVYVKNKGTIQNAKVGLHSINTNSYPSTGGGIIIANNATFRNNIVALQLEKYYSNSIANFVLCQFITDPDFFDGYDFKYFARLNEVGAVKFLGCSFVNTTTATNPINTGIGIYSNWSHFVVDQYCIKSDETKCIEYQKCKFDNLVYGIYNWGTLGGKTFSVRNSEFYLNDCGLFASSTYNAIVKGNIFTVSVLGDRRSGIYLDYCSGYVIEDNSFKYMFGESPVSAIRGIIINNSGEQDNYIYRNTFNLLEYGICAQDMNRNKDGSCGLHIKCNNFNNTKYDISITRSQPLAGYGIATAQGSTGDCLKPAGNLFSNLPTSTGYYGILNNCERIEYTHHSPTFESRVKPSNYTNSTVTLYPTGLEYSPACCPEHILGGGGSIDQDVIDQKTMADSIQSELSLLIDDGNTNDKLFIVNTALEEENFEIHTDLLNTSPFVSDTVIQTVIYKEDVFNNAMVRDIMVANPKSAKSETVLDILDNRIEPMPEYMRDEIMEGLDTLSMRELLEIKMQIGNSNYTYGFNRLLAESFNDSLNIDNLNNLLELDNTFTSKIKKAWLKFEMGDTLQAINKLDSINLTNQLSTAQILELNELRAYMVWLTEVDGIDSTNLVSLNYFMASPSAYVSASARGLLISNNLLQYSEPYLVPDFTKKSEVIKVGKNHLNLSTHVKIYPNPSKNYITIEYNLNGKNSNTTILIVDQSGKLVNTMALSKEQDQMLFSTKNLKPGNYFVRLIADGKLCATSRFTIIK